MTAPPMKELGVCPACEARIAQAERRVIEQARLWADITRHVHEDQGRLFDAVRALEAALKGENADS